MENLLSPYISNVFLHPLTNLSFMTDIIFLIDLSVSLTKSSDLALVLNVLGLLLILHDVKAIHLVSKSANLGVKLVVVAIEIRFVKNA